jgi:hypothetical protein
MEEYVEPEDEYDGLEREVGEGMKGGGREARREEEWRKHEGRREGGTKGGGREEEWRKHEGRGEGGGMGEARREGGSTNIK